MTVESVDVARILYSRFSLATGLLALATIVIALAVGVDGLPAAMPVALAVFFLGGLSGIFKAQALFCSDADLRRRFKLGPTPEPSATSAGIHFAVLRCEGVTRVRVFDDPNTPYHFAVLAWGGDEDEVRAAVEATKVVGCAAIIQVDSVLP